LSPIAADWLRAARARGDCEPIVPRLPLSLAAATPTASAHRIGSVEAAVAERMLAARLPIAVHAAGYCIAAPAAKSLAAVARWLHAEKIAAHWRDELLGVVDDEGRTVGAIERGVVRVLGVATEAVHLVGVDARGATWVQKRAMTKATDPGLWDTTMGGQVAAGERVGTTLMRETMEEAGIEVAALADLVHAPPILIRRPVREGYMVERIEVFRGVVADGIEPVNRDGEVERFERLDDAALIERLACGEFTLEATLILGAELERRGVVPEIADASG
jgi:8-oxo-dGTP pyrophosphatase MutT (NUDIX family)